MAYGIEDFCSDAYFGLSSIASEMDRLGQQHNLSQDMWNISQLNRQQQELNRQHEEDMFHLARSNMYEGF